MKKHVVFGAGLIGCFVGGVLTTLDHPTHLVCRSRIKKKLARGLKLTDYTGSQTIIKELQFIDSKQLQQEPQTPCDFLWLTVKCTGVERAAKDIRPLVGPETIIFCCQNGLGSDQIIKEHYRDNIVLRVMVPFNVAELADGHLHRGSEGALAIELPTIPRNRDIITSLIKELQHPIMPIKEVEDMHALLWAKLQLNLGNSINALADIPVKTMLKQRKYRLVIASLMDELLMVTKALNISLPRVTALPAPFIPKILRLPNLIFQLVANKMLAIDPTVRTSMWWDLSQGKQTEIDYLNGAILKHAKGVGIECPANSAIISLVKKVEVDQRNSIPRKAINGDQLLSLVRSSN